MILYLVELSVHVVSLCLPTIAQSDYLMCCAMTGNVHVHLTQRSPYC